jgi:hypothetical protein
MRGWPLIASTVKLPLSTHRRHSHKRIERPFVDFDAAFRGRA